VTTVIAIWRLLYSQQRRQFVILLLLVWAMAVTTLLSLAAVVPFFGALADWHRIHENRLLALLYEAGGFVHERSFLVLLGLAFLSLVLIANAVNYFGMRAMYRFANAAGDRFCVALFLEYLSRDLEFHAGTNSATLFSNVLWEVYRGTTGVLQAALTLSANLVTVLLIMVSLLVVNPLIAATTLLFSAGTYVLIYWIARRRLHKYGELQTVHMQRRSQIVAESYAAIREIALANCREFFGRRFEHSCRIVSSAVADGQIIAQSPRYVLESLAAAGLTGMALLLLASGQASQTLLPQLAFLAFAAYRLLPALQQAFGALAKLKTDAVAFRGIAADLVRAVRLERHVVPAGASSWSGLPRHEIRLTQLAFSYGQRPQRAIRDVSLRLPAGHVIGIVGATGSGKTTLADLLAGLLVPTSGSIFVDGMLLDETTRSSWQSTIGYVPQHVVLLDGSIASNIAFGQSPNEIDHERVVEVAIMAGLDGWIDALAEGYDTQIGQNGIRLSGGQRQRIAIARALYRRVSLLILDEATNALDGLTEMGILQGLLAVKKSCMLIVITHRLSTARLCDLIVEMEAGAVAHCDTYRQLAESSQRLRRLIEAERDRSDGAVAQPTVEV
jgi:ABC-type multidrug transport system fused ATPase/permease subunit